MRRKITEIIQRAGAVVLVYPMVLVMALVAVVSMVVFVDLGRLNSVEEHRYFSLIKLVITCCLGISLMFAVKMISQRFGWGTILELAGVLFLAVFYFVLPDTEKDFTQMYFFVVFPVFILSHLLVSFGAFLGKHSEDRFWAYNDNLFLNLVSTAIFTGVLTGGIMLAILAVDNLFDINIAEYRYSQIALFFLIFGSCFIFLLFSGNGLFSLEKDTDYPQILKFFTQFVLIPLLLIYLLILYFYSAKILLAWELPKGWVSYLILAYSVVGILAQLLIHPLKNDNARSWVKIFSKAFYYTLLPLLILLFVAINTRILQYGYTEPRYFVLLLALWLSAVVLYFILIKKATIKLIPVSLFAFILFALLMPYINAFSVSKRSQKKELMQILTAHQALQNGKLTANKSISGLELDEIIDKFQYLADRNEAPFLKAFINTGREKELWAGISSRDQWKIKQELLAFFGKETTGDREAKPVMPSIERANTPINIEDYTYVVQYNQLEIGITVNGDVFSANNGDKISSRKHRIYLNNSEYLDFTNFLTSQYDKAQKEGATTVPDLSYSGTLGSYRIRIIFESISRTSAGEDHVNFNGATVLIGLK